MFIFIATMDEKQLICCAERGLREAYYNYSIVHPTF